MRWHYHQLLNSDCLEVRKESGFEFLSLALLLQFMTQLFMSLFMWTVSATLGMSSRRDCPKNMWMVYIMGQYVPSIVYLAVEKLRSNPAIFSNNQLILKHIRKWWKMPQSQFPIAHFPTFISPKHKYIHFTITELRKPANIHTSQSLWTFGTYA